MKTDARIRADVGAELRWTFSATAPEIGVSVKDAVVKLSGVVSNPAEKRAAGEAVERVAGVRAIRNVIAVHVRREAVSEAAPRDESSWMPGGASDREWRPSYAE